MHPANSSHPDWHWSNVADARKKPTLSRTRCPLRQDQEIDRRFPSSEYAVLIVVEGENLLARPQLQAFSQTVVDLQLEEGVNGLVSMLSARGKPDASGYAPPIVPDELPEGSAYDD